MEHVAIAPGNIHVPHNWTFANAAARTAQVITDAALLQCLALQSDDGTYWRLTAVSPAQWAPMFTDTFTAGEKAKLAGVAAGATANSSDDTLLSRANHTGTQSIATVSGLQTALDAALDRANHTGTQAIATVSGLQAALDARPVAAVAADAAASFNIGTTHANQIIPVNASAAVVATIQPDSAVTLSVGTSVTLVRKGTGGVSFAAGAGVTARTSRSLAAYAQNSTIVATKLAANDWVVAGELL